MYIGVFNEKQFEASKRLWLDSFPEDDIGFVDWYYSARTKPCYALGAFPEGEDTPVSMLHMIPMRMRFHGRETSVCFVAGVCTEPSYRRRGLCSELIGHAFGIMRARGFEATVLQPFDTAFYERFGYAPYAFRRKLTFSAEWLNKLGRTAEAPAKETTAPEKLADIYDSFTSAFSGCGLRDAEYFKGFIEEYSKPGAYLACSQNACCAGYAEGESFAATELFYKGDPKAALRLLPTGFTRYTVGLPVSARLLTAAPDIASAAEPYCMAAPVAEGFDLTPDAGEEYYCLDRY